MSVSIPTFRLSTQIGFYVYADTCLVNLVGVRPVGRSTSTDTSPVGRSASTIHVTDGQLEFELAHLRGKVERRAPEQLCHLPTSALIEAHPLFLIREGTVESWGKGQGSPSPTS